MSQQQQDDARDILAALRSGGEPGAEVPHPGAESDLRGLTDDARRRTLADYDKKLQAHIEYINSKPGGKLTEAEQKTLWKATMKALRDGE